MEQKREENPASPRNVFTRGLRNHRKKQACAVAEAVITELELIGLKRGSAARTLTVGHEIERWLREPCLVEFGALADIIKATNKAIADRDQNRKLTLRVRIGHSESGWNQDFEFCDVCPLLPVADVILAAGKGREARTAKARLKGPKKGHERCSEAGRQRGLVVLHGYRVPDVCEPLGLQLFHPKNGIPFTRKDVVGRRLQENLKVLGTSDPLMNPKKICDLFKVAFTAKVELRLRVAAVDADGAVIAEYGDEGVVEVGSTSEDPAERDRSLAHVLGAFVTSMVSGSPPGELRLAEG